ncbi:MAG: hypothetical protein ACP5O1_00530 [Phycisphaerae bacterium]
MSDYDRRQFKMMLSILDAFDDRAIGLRKAIDDLEALYRSLEDTPKAWKSLFYKQWAIMEEVYAGALDKGYKQLPPDYQKLIEDAIQNLRRLVQERIDVTEDARANAEGGGKATG